MADTLSDTLPVPSLKRNVPYDIPFQGSNRKWLFLDSSGMILSATAVNLAAKVDINARSAGTNLNRALQPVTLPILDWAERIFFLTEQSYNELMELLQANQYDKDKVLAKSTKLDITDEYFYLQPGLVFKLKELIPELGMLP